MRWIVMVLLAGCGSSQATTAPPPEQAAPPTHRESDAGSADPAADAGAPSETAEADGGQQPARSRSGPVVDAPVEPGCDEESERQCRMRGGNCRLVLDSPCVGRGARCRDFELEQASGCRCYCQPVDAAGRPVLPR